MFKLPWPYVKLSYIAALSICFAAVFMKAAGNEFTRKKFSADFQFFFICMIMSALLGAASSFVINLPAATDELNMQLRIIPFINQKDNFISLRFLWLWCCGVAFYWAISRFIKNAKDVTIIFWSMQWCALIAAWVGIYSYTTKKYMVDFYVYERRICSTFSSPAALADITTVIFIIGFFLLKHCNTRWKKIILSILMVSQLISIFLSGCRANIIVLLLFAAGWMVIYLIKDIKKRKWKRPIIIPVFSIILILTVYKAQKLPYVKKIPLIERITYWKNTIKSKKNFVNILFEGRRWHWECAANMIENSPLWGIGSGMFEQKYQQFKINSDMFSLARAHNVPLRILAEGGVITFISFLILLLFGALRLSRAFTKNIKKLFPKEASMLRGVALGLLALLLLSLFSDIVLVRDECVFFVAITLACAATLYNKFPPVSFDKFTTFQEYWKRAERRMRRSIKWFGWDYLAQIRLISVTKFLALLILFIFFCIGYINISKSEFSRPNKKQLEYGFYNKVPGGKAKHAWLSMGKNAAAVVNVKKDIFYFGYRAVNKRMALLNQKLKLYINGVLIAELPLNSLKEHWAYFNAASLKGQKIIIEYKTDTALVPLKKRWFADGYAYGAVITKPLWINKKNYKKIYNKRKGKWINSWPLKTDSW